MNFLNAHLQSPKHLAPGRDFAPALVIYADRAATLEVTDTEIDLVVGGDSVTVSYVGKSLEDVAAEISAASSAVQANPVNSAFLMTENFLYWDGEVSPDGGFVVRMRGHVVRYEEETRIRALDPYPEHRSRPWYPRVDRGKVRVRRQGVDYLFGIPEYAEQEWSTYFGAPFVDVTGERPRLVSEKLLQVARTPLFWHRENLRLVVDSIPTGASIVEDVDVHNGLVKLRSPVSSEERIFVDYTYRELSLVYKEVNLNPSMAHNPMVVDHVVLLYVLPETDSLGRTRTKTVHHTISKTIVGAISAIPSDELTLILGAYQVRPTAVVEDLKVTDTRTRGGGLEEEKVKASLARNAEARGFADVGRFDGLPFPGAIGGVLRLPRSLMDRFDAAAVEALVRKHLAAGGTLVVDFNLDN